MSKIITSTTDVLAPLLPLRFPRLAILFLIKTKTMEFLVILSYTYY